MRLQLQHKDQGSGEIFTSFLISESELPGQKVAINGCKLAPVNVDCIISLPQVPPLVHLADDIALPILNVHVAVDQVEGPAHPEDDLRSCTAHTFL